MKKAILGLLLGLTLGSLTAAHAAKVKQATVYDANGKALHVGDVILGSTNIPIKIHGFTTVYEPGTFAAYSDQVVACPTCNWVETNPELARFTPQEPTTAVSLAAKFSNWLLPEVHAQEEGGGDGRSIIWGS